jgi:arylsulfatase A-like enzyme
MSDKPREIREHQFHVDQTFDFEDERAHRLRMLMSVDALVADVWATIDGFDERESTWGVYASDNGLLWGEHWLRRKFFAYDESIRVRSASRCLIAGRQSFRTHWSRT